MCLVRCKNLSLLKPEAISEVNIIHLISSILFSPFVCLLQPIVFPYEDAWLGCLLHCCHRPAFPEGRAMGVSPQANPRRALG